MGVDGVEGARVDFGGDGGVFLGPLLKNVLELGASFGGLLQLLIGLFIEVVLDGEGSYHQVEDDAFEIPVFNVKVNYIMNVVGIGADDAFSNIPVGLFDQVGQEYHFDFVQQEKFTYGFYHLMNGKL